jgi:type IV pilus assembly protein PilB
LRPLAAAQRLLKKVCPFCKEPIRVPKDVLERIQYVPSEEDGEPQFMRGRGCSKCKNTGYKGRVAVVEAMPNYPEVQELLMHHASGHEIMLAAMRCGMRTLRQNALSKAARGITTIEQALEHTTAE